MLLGISNNFFFAPFIKRKISIFITEFFGNAVVCNHVFHSEPAEGLWQFPEIKNQRAPGQKPMRGWLHFILILYTMLHSVLISFFVHCTIEVQPFTRQG